MDIRSKFSFNIPEALIEVLGITEDTPFVVSFEDGKLTVEPILDDTVDDLMNMGSEFNSQYEEGYEKGIFDGYANGYRKGFDDATDGRSFDDTYPADCDYDCSGCRFYNPTNRIRNTDEE